VQIPHRSDHGPPVGESLASARRPASSAVYPRPLSCTFCRRPPPSVVRGRALRAPPSAFRGRALRDPPPSGIEPSGPSAFRARGRSVREHRPLPGGFEPAELLTAALVALFLALPLAVVVAAGVRGVPRRMVSGPGLGIGIGLLAWVVLAAVSIVAGPLGFLPT